MMDGLKTEDREFLLWIASHSSTNKSMCYCNFPIHQLDACPKVLHIWYAFLMPWYWLLEFIYSYLIFHKAD